VPTLIKTSDPKAKEEFNRFTDEIEAIVSTLKSEKK
jgi:hypothetical protein